MKKNNEEENNLALCMSVGMCIGAGLGSVIGILTKNLTMCMCFGIPIGMSLGVAIGSLLNSKK